MLIPAGRKKIARLLQKYTQDVINLSNKNIQLVILFGLVARGEWSKGSDIDILAVVSEKKKDVIATLNKGKIAVSPLLEIRPISTTVNKFTEGFSKKTEFYEELWKDRIVLYNEFYTHGTFGETILCTCNIFLEINHETDFI